MVKNIFKMIIIIINLNINTFQVNVCRLILDQIDLQKYLHNVLNEANCHCFHKICVFTYFKSSDLFTDFDNNRSIRKQITITKVPFFVFFITF